ncbi:MAG: class I SAM-dependent methyltransferase [Planctomycetaceae bacterium]|nr:class I SAM-dependent methyltransferase [Planctomycetaceae bacterium]
MPVGSDAVQLEKIACPLCQAAEYRHYLTGRDVAMGVPGTFQLVTCRSCRHIYMNPRPTLETLAACYPSGYGPHRSQEHGDGCSVDQPKDLKSESQAASSNTSQPWYLRSFVRSIPGLKSLYRWLSDTRSTVLPAAPDEGSRALELGCGTGQFLESLKAVGWNCEGVELVTAAAEQARGRGFEIHEGTLESAQFSDSSFDAAFAWHVLEHLPDVRSSLIELHRVLKPQGLLACSMPNVGCWEPYVFGGNWYLWEWPRHLHFFNPKRLRRLLEETGFEEIRIEHQRNSLNVVGSLGLLLRRMFPNSRLAARILEFPNRPTMWGQLAMAPFAIVMAWLHQGGRITVTARCRKNSTSGEQP